MSILATTDFGTLAFLALPIAKALDGFFLLTGNYGFAIIIASFLLRLALLPLQLLATKASDKMATLQPKLLQIKQDFNGDPERTRTETIRVMQEAGVNPLMTIIPVVLQLPFFLAFFRVISAFTKVSQTPFIGWLKNLSLPDPYYVLPILLGASYFLQQRLMPSPPVQMNGEGVAFLRYLPLIFAVMMINIPAGVALYSLTGSIFQLGITGLKRFHR